MSTKSLHADKGYIMDDKQLYSLLKIVECGSFSKAEEVLFLSKQALKKQIDSLEDEVGFPLTIRTHQGIALTKAGEEFCRGIRRVLAELSSVTQHCKEIAFNDQVIRIANPYHPRLLLEDAFDEFARRFPHVKQNILLQTTEHLVEDILSDRADLAECTYHQKFEVPGVACTKLFPIPYKCLLSAHHPLADRHMILQSELSGFQVYVRQVDAALISQLTENCSDIKLNYMNRNNINDIINICYNNGIFISKAYYINAMQPLITVPIETDIVPMAAVLHRESPNWVVQEFIKVIRSLHPYDDSQDNT